jgi:hypothetical protein
VRALVILAILGGWWLLSALPLASAQQVQLRTPPGPFYLGAPIELRLTVEDFEEQPQPEASVPTPERGRLELAGVSPQVSSSITIVNGRVSQSKQVRFVYQYRYFPEGPGSVELGPFVVTQGAVSRTTRSVRLEIREVPLSDRLRVLLRLPEKATYVGEHIPITLEFWLESGLQENLHSYTLRAPVFDKEESFQFLDDAAARGDIDVAIETASGRLRVRGTLSQAMRDGRRFVVISVKRMAVPLRSGKYLLDPATLVVRELSGRQPGLFGRRGAVPARELRATDDPRILEVKPVPREGMPPSFASAVGHGFTIDVSADRSIVQVGDPITLTVTLRGEGNLETAGLPSLNAEGLLQASDFRVPGGDLAGRYEEGEKRFSVVVRVQNENVRELPALAYSWFDPEREAYETTYSRPIALSVRPAEVIAAQDVFGAPTEGEEESSAVPEEEGAKAPGRGFALTGADLAIEREAAALLRDRRQALGGPWIPVGVYTGASLLLLAAFLDRRRRDIDPAVVRRRRLLDGELRRVRAAERLPPEQAVPELAQAIRRMLVEVPGARTSEVEAFLRECDARTYAPSGRPSHPLDEAFHAQAVALARRVAESAR